MVWRCIFLCGLCVPLLGLAAARPSQVTTPGQRLWSAFVSEKRAKGGSLSADDFIRVGDELVSIFRQEWAREAKARKRKEAPVDERAADILNVYPRREGGQAALLSITKAIAHDGFVAVLEKTTEYASAVARWQPGRKRSVNGTSLIPLPTTFFNNRRYMDDPAQWWEGTGGKQKAQQTEVIAPEPEGWRFRFPDSRPVLDNTPWAQIDATTRGYITEQMKQSHTA